MSLPSSGQEPYFLDIELAIRQIGDAQAMQGMLPILEESLARDIPRIAQLLAQDDVDSASRVLHSLKGFIPIFCGEALCTLVSTVYELSKKGNAQDVRAAYAQLKPDLELLQSEVVGYMDENGAAF